MFCLDNNPVSREMLLAYCRFAEKHDLHLISDEVYALSVFENDSEYSVLVYTTSLEMSCFAPLDIRLGKSR